MEVFYVRSTVSFGPKEAVESYTAAKKIKKGLGLKLSKKEIGIVELYQRAIYSTILQKSDPVI